MCPTSISIHSNRPPAPATTGGWSVVEAPSTCLYACFCHPKVVFNAADRCLYEDSKPFRDRAFPRRRFGRGGPRAPSSQASIAPLKSHRFILRGEGCINETCIIALSQSPEQALLSRAVLRKAVLALCYRRHFVDTPESSSRVTWVFYVQLLPFLSPSHRC